MYCPELKKQFNSAPMVEKQTLIDLTKKRVTDFDFKDICLIFQQNYTSVKSA